MKLLCPVCKSELTIEAKTAKCLNGHCFDVSKEGYINLLLSNKKNSNFPGDNKEMVSARDLFLSKGYYSVLRDAILEETLKLKNSKISILDAGCGTGYYSIHIAKNRNTNDELIGVDISKFAVQKAAKHGDNYTFITGSAFDLPIADDSCDIILNIFSPKANIEFIRVLKQDGYLIEVMPGEKHLWELKEILYGKDVRENVVEYSYAGFNNIEIVPIKYIVDLSTHNDIMNLLTMTPYFYKTKVEDIRKLDDINELKLTLDFKIVVWRKNK